jgi:hypothetical protein
MIGCGFLCMPVTDFSIAYKYGTRLVDEELSSGQLAGIFAFMSPDQLASTSHSGIKPAAIFK